MNATLTSKNNLSNIEIMDEPLQPFVHEEPVVQVPPDARLRTFHVADILGDFDYDEKGNIIVLQDEDGNI